MRSTAAVDPATASRAAAGAAGAAFGLAVEGRVRLPGLAPLARQGGRRLRLERASREAVDAACPPDQGRRAGGVGRRIELREYGAGGYVWRAPGYGSFQVSRDGRRATCAPAHVPSWRWQRMLVAQVLPLAALLQGIEVLHAGAVVAHGSAIGIAGASGAGKSTLVAALMAHGAAFLADDVLAVERAGDRVVAHAGPGLMSLRTTALPGLAGASAAGGEAQEVLGGLGSVAGRDGESWRLVVSPADGPAPLRALVVLQPVARAGAPQVTVLDPGDPRPLLGATFNYALRAPDRLTRQLDVCARVAASARLLSVSVPRAGDPSRVAQTIMEVVG